MKRILIILFFTGITVAAIAQPQRHPGDGPGPGAGMGLRGARVQGLKIEFITRYLKLTPEEAPFWTVFYEYSDALKKARTEQPEDVIGTDEKLLGIKKKYRGEFKKVLGTDERAMKVFTIDREFNGILKAELAKRAQQRKENS